MKTEQIEVKEFMLKADQVCPDKPTIPTLEVRKLRLKLIAEELLELAEAFNLDMEIIGGEVKVFEGVFSEEYHPKLTAAVGATTDLRVMVIGTDVAMGIDGEPCWNEVHRSNMSKFILREDGKWIKGPSYLPANLAPIISAQM